MKKLLLLSALLICGFGFSQTLTVVDGSRIAINTNSSISVDGLQLAPSAAYTIAGPNAFSRTSAPIVVMMKIQNKLLEFLFVSFM